MIDTIKRMLSEYEIRPITAHNYMELMELYESNEDYFILTDGEAPSADRRVASIREVPPDFDIANKHFVSIWRNGEAIAILDVLKGYSSPECVWIGLLLIHAEWKGKQIGKGIVEAVSKAASTHGFMRIELGVIANNLAGLAFWCRMGFVKVRECMREAHDPEAQSIIVMEKRLY